MVVCVMANEQQNVLKEKKTVTISIEEYETFKAENARLNQQIQWLLEAYVFLKGERICDECGHMIQEIGKEVRRTLQIVPAQVRIRH